MSALREIQQRFVEAVLSGCFEPIVDEIRVAGSAPERRLSIYRNNTLANLRNTLHEIYPIVEALVGAAFFRQIADAYIAVHPSTSGDLNDYGASLADFLVSFPQAGELPYLADVAQLEWALEQACYAPDHTPLELQRLAQIAPPQYGDLRLKLHPAATLIQSSYPLYAIWQAHQSDHHGEGSVDLDSGGATLLVTRRGWQTLIEPLDQGEFIFLDQLSKRQPLSCALAAALQHDPTFPLRERLLKRVGEGDIADFMLDA